MEPIEKFQKQFLDNKMQNFFEYNCERIKYLTPKNGAATIAYLNLPDPYGTPYTSSMITFSEGLIVLFFLLIYYPDKKNFFYI